MQIEDAWTLTLGLPVRLPSGRFGKLTYIDIENEILKIEIFDGNRSMGSLDYSLEQVARFKDGCDALVVLCKGQTVV